MIFAIVAFVVVMVLGTVVYTAGYANYSKLFGRKASRQDYYALISTARVLSDELDGATITVTETYTGVVEDGGAIIWVEPPEQSVSVSGKNWVSDLLDKAHSKTPGKTNFSVSLESDGYGADTPDTITAELTQFQLDHEGGTRGKTRRTELVLTCGTRSVTIEINVSPAYLEDQTGLSAEEPQYVKQTVYTLRTGEIK